MHNHVKRLYDVIRQLQQTPSTKDKEQILKDNVNFDDLREYLRLTYCPTIVFGIGEKTIPKVDSNSQDEEYSFPFEILENLYNRKYTGNDAINYLKSCMFVVSKECSELLSYAILKDARIKVSAKTINKIWENLVVDIPYQRCSLVSKEYIDRINNSGHVYTQLKADGMFVVTTYDGMYTRNGNKMPKWFSSKFNHNFLNNDVVEGEIIWYGADNKLLPREEGNGISNHVLKGGDIPEGFKPHYKIWNYIPRNDWDNHHCKLPYYKRYDLVDKFVRYLEQDNISMIDTCIHNSFEEVMDMNNEILKLGGEGVIVKFSEGEWKYNTSKDCIKIKVTVDVDMKIVSMVEATGKNAGMVGRINVVSEDGLVFCGVNANGTEKQRKELWENRDKFTGMVIECQCNDILTSDSKDGYSLFLGRANPSNIREDKNVADDLTRILEIFEAAGIVKDFK